MTIIINTQTDAEKLCKNDNYNNRVIKLDDDLKIACDLTLTDVTIDCEYHEIDATNRKLILAAIAARNMCADTIIANYVDVRDELNVRDITINRVKAWKPSSLCAGVINARNINAKYSDILCHYINADHANISNLSAVENIRVKAGVIENISSGNAQIFENARWVDAG